MQSQPLFILGAPRSGTTFLTTVLNRHPSVHITNESKIFIVLQDLIELRARHHWLLGLPFQTPFVNFVRSNAGAWVEAFYRDTLGIRTPIWGDKHPHYANPKVLNGEARLLAAKAKQYPEVQTGSCLRLIRDLLPTAKFVHIHRDPRRVAWSVLRKGWAPTLDEATNVWRRLAEEIESFFHEIPPSQTLRISYLSLLNAPKESVATLMRFLDLEDGEALLSFLAAQKHQPTAVSAPEGDLDGPELPDMPAGDLQRVLEQAGPLARQLGYV
jgi:hypothetical protein